jgi:hypothetical protein
LGNGASLLPIAQCPLPALLRRRRLPPRAMQYRERGHRTTAIRIQIRQPFGARVGDVCHAGGAILIVARLRSSPIAFYGGAIIVRTFHGCTRIVWMRERRHDGRPCGCCQGPHSSDRWPRYPRELLLASVAETNRRLPQPGTTPVPQSRSAAASQTDRSGGSMGAAWGAGITFPLPSAALRWGEGQGEGQQRV